MSTHRRLDGPELIGGEMYGWSDLGSRAAGGAPAFLFGAEPLPTGGHVLVAGPHDTGLVRRLTQTAEVSWLTRSHPDAVELAEEFPAVRMLAGSLAKLPSGDRYDMIVALDGTARLCSTEGTTLTWSESVEVLRSVLAPGGTLLLTVDNPIGVHRLVAPDPWYADRGDGAWRTTDGVDATMPGGLAELRDRLSGLGLDTMATYAAFADPTRPAVLVGVDLLGEDVPAARRRALAEVVGAASVQDRPDHPQLSDPRWLAGTAVRHGTGAGIAAGWVVAARRSPPDAPATGPTRSGTGRVVVTDAPGTDDWSVTAVLEPTGTDGWSRRVTHPRSVPSAGTLSRDPAVLNGPVPVGELLEDHLIALCLRHDRPGLRQALTGYVAWLSGLHGTGDPRAPFALPGNVYRTRDGFEIRDASWRDTAPLGYPVLLAGALRAFAVELLTAGYHHPWPSSIDADQLTVVLGAIAGVDVETTAIDAAVAHQVHVAAIVGGLDDDARRELAHRLGEAGATSGGVDGLSVQRLRQAHARQAEEIARLRDRMEWLDRLLNSRELALTRSQNHVRSLKNSISFRVGRMVIRPALSTRTLSRRAMTRLRNPARPDDESPPI